MQLIYYAHSYRDPDAHVVEFFAELMRSEGLVPSLDPPSDQLNSAKPERHLRSTDGMVAVLTAREGGVSQYILYELSLCLRTKKPLLVFVEDVLPDGLVPARILQRRFSRKGLLRQVREHRHATRIMKTYLGDEPPPMYQPGLQRRTCLIVGAERFAAKTRREIEQEVRDQHYEPMHVGKPDASFIYDRPYLEMLANVDLAICFVSAPRPSSQYVFGALRAFLTPAILLTADPNYPFHPEVPQEYQPRVIVPTRAASLRETIRTEISIFEQEYVDLDDQEKVARYAELLIKEASPAGHYSESVRPVFVNELVMGHKVGGNMSQDRIRVDNVGGVVNIKSSLENVVQIVHSAKSLSTERRTELSALIKELQQALEPLAKEHPEETDRVAKSAEMVVSEAVKEKPNRSFLDISIEGLKEAAKAVESIAPTVIKIAGKVAAFVAALS
jgi:hypothetical protein